MANRTTPPTNNNLPIVPASTVAAPDGCIRVTAKNRFGEGVSVVFRLETLESYLDSFGKSIGPDMTPGRLLSMVKQIAGERKKEDHMISFMGLAVLWVAKNNDKSMMSAIGDIVDATGRAALQVREMRDGDWSFDVGQEIGTREVQPVSGGGIVR